MKKLAWFVMGFALFIIAALIRDWQYAMYGKLEMSRKDSK